LSVFLIVKDEGRPGVRLEFPPLLEEESEELSLLDLVFDVASGETDEGQLGETAFRIRLLEEKNGKGLDPPKDCKPYDEILSRFMSVNLDAVVSPINPKGLFDPILVEIVVDWILVFEALDIMTPTP
jgi:hypothetical protein